MTTTLRAQRRAGLNGETPAELRPRSAASHATRRNRSRIAVGLLVIAISVLGVAAVVARGGESQSVLAIASDIPAGGTIEATDLVAVEIPADSELAAIGEDQADALLGQAATVTLYRGTLITRSHVSPEARVPDGSALAGAVLDPGQYPVDLRVGDRVALINTAPANSINDDLSSESVGFGEVREIAEPPIGTGALVVSLLVPEDSADAIAAAGAHGRISLVVVGTR